MSNLEDQAAGRVRHYGVQNGKVVDNEDPEGLHRIRMFIPGKVEPATDWLWPITTGGGSKQRGGHAVPAVGAAVCAWFHDGDLDGEGYYACGWWGIPDEGAEMPVDIQEDKAQAHLVSSWQWGTLSVTLDEREGTRKLIVSESTTGDHILWDVEKQGLEVAMTAGILLKAIGAVTLQGIQIAFGKGKGARLVLPNGTAI